MRTLLLVVLLALWPSDTRAQASWASPATVGAAMLPCVTRDGRIPVEMRATIGTVEFWEYPEQTMRSRGDRVATLYHAEREPSARSAGTMAYLEDDPSSPPLLLDLWETPREDRPRYADCFYAAYHP